MVDSSGEDGINTEQTILVVDDNIAVLSLIKRTLKRPGYTVMTADSGKAVLDIFKEFSLNIDLVISDVRMPEMNGIRLREELLEIDPFVKILFISGSGKPADFPQSDRIQFVAKPFLFSNLKEKVVEMLNNGCCRVK